MTIINKIKMLEIERITKAEAFIHDSQYYIRCTRDGEIIRAVNLVTGEIKHFKGDTKVTPLYHAVFIEDNSINRD